MQNSVKSQAVAFQKLAEEPRLRRAILAGSAISLSVAYAQVPADHLLARQFSPGLNFKAAEFAPLPGFRQAAGTTLFAAAPAQAEPVFGAKDIPSVDMQGSAAFVPALAGARGDRPSGVAATARLMPAETGSHRLPKHAGIIPRVAGAAAGGDASIQEAQLEAAMASTPAVGTAVGASIRTEALAEQPALAPTQVSVTSAGTQQNNLGAATGLTGNADLQPSTPGAIASPASPALAAVDPAPIVTAQPASMQVDLQAVVAKTPENLVAPSVSAAPPALATGTGKAGAASLVPVLNSANHFDLGALNASARVPRSKAPGLAASSASRNFAAKPGVARTRPAVGRTRDRIEGDSVFHLTQVNIDDVPSGKLSVRIGMNGDLSLRLGDLLSLYEKDMAPAAFAHLSGSSATQEFVSFGTLRNAGIDIRYEAGRDCLAISARD